MSQEYTPTSTFRTPEAIKTFHMPTYDQIPNVGLYLEQTTRYINETLSPLGCIEITSSMISNYVKKGYIKRPVKKQYDAEQIAYLLFIAIAKQVLPMENIALLLELQKKTYPVRQAYVYLCTELETMLRVIFGIEENVPAFSQKNTDQKEMLRSTIVAVSHMILLNYRFEELKSR